LFQPLTQLSIIGIDAETDEVDDANARARRAAEARAKEAQGELFGKKN
jgi:hypothetical protein